MKFWHYLEKSNTDHDFPPPLYVGVKKQKSIQNRLSPLLMDPISFNGLVVHITPSSFF